jgi:uncharacterized membrane protein
MPDASSNRGLMIVLAYLWPLAIVPMLVERQDEVRWHARHGVALMIAEIVALAAAAVLVAVVTLLAFDVGVVLSLLVVILAAAILPLHLMAIVRGLRGGRLHVPGVSAFADRKRTSRPTSR